MHVQIRFWIASHLYHIHVLFLTLLFDLFYLDGLVWGKPSGPSTCAMEFRFICLGPLISFHFIIFCVCVAINVFWFCSDSGFVWVCLCVSILTAVAPFLTRTTRTPAFWGYPAASWLPIPLSHIGSQVKRRQSQSYKLKKNLWILKWALHATHLLKLLDKMCKYEMGPMSILDDTERTRFCPQTDRRTRWYQYTPFQLRGSGGIITRFNFIPSMDK